MQALEDTIAALGQPAFVRALGSPAEPKAAIARWRHGPAIVDVRPSDSIRLAMSLVDGRNARLRGGPTTVDQAHGASVSVFSPTEGASVEVCGEADVIQLFLDQSFVEWTLDASFACPPLFDLRDDRMRTTMMRILVGSARRGPDDGLMLEEDLHALMLRIQGHASRRERDETPSALFRGGLSPAAFRRVDAMIKTALDEATSPTLEQLASAAGLSVTHFVRAFREHTGRTPHKYLIRRRMERAVSLLRVARIPVAEVADEAGFSTPAHFVASFRTEMGVTPGALREALVG
jgi:AraC family transcriptional regulator